MNVPTERTDPLPCLKRELSVLPTETHQMFPVMPILLSHLAQTVSIVEVTTGGEIVLTLPKLVMTPEALDLPDHTEATQ